jgi:hypothetical protein
MMSELDNNCKEVVIDLKKIDIFAKYVLAKSEFKNTQILFQEAYNENAVGTGEKLPFRLLIINHNSVPGAVPDTGAGVRCIKLYKRVIADGYPVNIMCPGKSRVTIRYQLILVVEYEDGFVDILTLPNNLSNPFQYNPLTTKAFVDSTVISPAGMPVVQHQNITVPHETLVIVSNGVNDYPWFDYSINIPLSYFEKYSKHFNLNCAELESYVLLKCLHSDVDILSSQLVPLNAENTLFVWTTEVALSVFEDIIDKLGMDSDIIICGSPEYECEKDCPKPCDCQ